MARAKVRVLKLSIFLISVVIIHHFAWSSRADHISTLAQRQEQFPLVWDHIHMSSGHGGGEYMDTVFQSYILYLSPHFIFVHGVTVCNLDL